MLKDEFVKKLNGLSKESLIKYLSSTNFYNERDLIFKECSEYEIFKLNREMLEILSRKSELISNKNNSIDKVEKEFNKLGIKFNKLCKKFDNLKKEYESITI
ncbi:hypothetical protein [Clostridium perfringens]|uniref:Uncharacterized protein n=1 Tax=Clostridium perfringens TaxID=1502 RepID=A0AAP4A899_CLOPF|nr:hypothetical protein [Clostridium perfringens]MDH2334589.1 hypothetical protein [Clostridium perfringens]